MKNVRLTLAAVVVALLALATAGCPPPPDPLDANHAPIARMVLPQLAPVSVPVSVSGSLSSDEDGDGLSYVVDWGDGTPSTSDDDGVVEHTYAAPSTYAVQLTVQDDGGALALVLASVVVVGDTELGSCCELGCFDDAACTGTGCMLFRSSDDEETAPPDEAFEPAGCP